MKRKRMTTMNNFLDTIRSGNAEAVLSEISKMEDEIVSNQNMEVVNWITMPVNFTETQTALIETFGIHPRQLMLRNKVPSRVRRAVLFLKMFRIAVERTVNE